jgi:hypothetical protein
MRFHCQEVNQWTNTFSTTYKLKLWYLDGILLPTLENLSFSETFDVLTNFLTILQSSYYPNIVHEEIYVYEEKENNYFEFFMRQENGLSVTPIKDYLCVVEFLNDKYNLNIEISETNLEGEEV